MKMNIIFPENVKKYTDLQCNDALFKYTDFPELKNIEDRLKTLEPNNVLEIGAGIGRASVYLFKYFNWINTNFYLLDGNSGDKQINGVNYESKDSFYNSIDAAKEFCESNGLFKVWFLNAEKEDWKEVNVKFDLCYSFLAIGFHWPVGLYLNAIYDLLVDNALLIFGIRPVAEKFDKFMNSQIKDIGVDKYKIVEIKREKRGSRSSIMILRKI